MCHPAIVRMLAFIRSQNLPFSVDDVRKMIKSCQICNECEPCFYSYEPTKLIKATQPTERFNLDFKGPLPSNSNNKYILTIADEYPRFPFLIPCEHVEAVYKTLCQILPFLEYLHIFIQIDLLLL